MVKKYMNNLSEQILLKIQEGNYTINRFADECDISPRELSRIKNREADSIRVETLVKICESHNIPYTTIFEASDEISISKIIERINGCVLKDRDDLYSIALELKKK